MLYFLWYFNNALFKFFIFSAEVVNNEVDPLFSEQKRLKKSKLRDKREKSFPCGKCDYVTTHSSNLKTHIHSKHEGVKYSCNRCKYAATEPSSLKKHIKNKHEGVRYPCDQCEYAATTAADLKIHIESKHEGLRYPCDKCEFSAT